MIPIGTDRPQRLIPWMNYLLIASNVVVYLLSHTTTPGHMRDSVSNLAPWCTPYILDPSHLRLYQFLSYQFLHENLGHIFFNMLFLYVFGNNLNEKLGHWTYLLFYLTGGVLAGCGQVLTSTNPTLGASGAISAVTGLFLVLLPRTNIRMFIWIFMYADFWEIPSLYFILFSVLKDFFEPLIGSGTQTAHAAHIAGNVAGFAIGLFLLFTHLVQRDHYDLLAMLNRWRRRRQYESLVAGGYDPFAPSRLLRKTSNEAEALNDARLQEKRGEVGELIRQQQPAAAAAAYLQLLALDGKQVLPPQEQLDVANHFMTAGQHAQAARAYEDFLRAYPAHHERDHVVLVLAVVYARYLGDAARAMELFRMAIPRMHDEHQRKWAEGELAVLLGTVNTQGERSETPPAPPNSRG